VSFTREREVAERLALEAGEVALRIQREGFGVEEKPGDEGPVTDADRAASEFLVRELSRAFPGDLVISEEVKPAALSAEEIIDKRIWYIDPIDGTREFARHGSEWSVMIGLSSGARARVGVVYQPGPAILYSASEGDGAFRKDGPGEARRIHVTGLDLTDRESLVMVRSRSHPSRRVTTIADKLGVRQYYQHGSVGLKVAHVAEGRAHLYFNLSGKCSLWDTCGPEVILLEAGGVIQTFTGRRIEYRYDGDLKVDEPYLAAGSWELAEQVLKEI
jgi:3'(2'), 5'-bisphosphate nucleotidase